MPHRSTVLVAALIAASFVSAAVAVEYSTATGNTIRFENEVGVATLEGDAKVVNSSGTLTADTMKIYSKTKDAIATGNVRLEQSSSVITGTQAEYNWVTSTGVVHDAEGHTPPWRFKSDRLVQVEPRIYFLDDNIVTSCEHNPPHYYIRANKSKVLAGNRITMKNPRLMLDQTPSFYLPFYSRSLIPKKYQLRIEPGHTSRDGTTVKTIFGYPFTRNSYTKIRWDFLERTGNGIGVTHRYNNPDLKGDLDWYYIRDINPDPQPQTRRYSLLWNNFTRIIPRLTLNSKIDLKSDRTIGNQFNNVGNDVYVENLVRGLLSEAGFNYQFPRMAVEAQFSRQDRFDARVSSSNFISKLVLPKLTFNTVPIKTRLLPFYMSFSGSYTNETRDRVSPKQVLRYQQSASLSSLFKKDIKVGRRLNVTPFLGYDQLWRDRDLSIPEASHDIYSGRYNAGVDFRRKFRRSINTTLGYLFAERFRQNKAKVDTGAPDRGVEQNQATIAADARVGRDSRISLSSGFDFRTPPRNDSQRYEHTTERITPPSLDFQWQVKPKVVVYFRETYSLFDPRTRSIILTPLNTSGELQIGNFDDKTFFSQGFSYSKTQPGQDPQLFLNNKIRFYPSPNWYVDFFLSYRAVAKSKMDYSKAYPIEKTLRVARDLHCWVLRMEFSERTDAKEVSFYIDLKANVRPQANLFDRTTTQPNTIYRNEGPDISEIFPSQPPVEPDEIKN